MTSGNSAAVPIAAIRSKQAEFFKSGVTKDLDFRLRSLERLEQQIEARGEVILDALAADLGKPRIEAYLAELYFVIDEIRLFRRKLKKWAKPERVGAPFFHFPIRNEIRREPFGCTLILAPWNYPFQIAMAPLIASVAAGNCAVLKPSEHSPATSQVIRKIIDEVFDPGHAIVVEGGADISGELVAEPFDFVLFTGLERIGKKVAVAAAEHLTPVVLELGGKCPVIVDETADLEMAANRIVSAKFFNAGQTCFAPDFVAAHESIRDDLATQLIEQIKIFYSADSKKDMARMINRQQYERMQSLAGDSEEGFQLDDDDPECLYFSPRVFSRNSWDSPLMKDEIFGPILPVVDYVDEDPLIEKLNAMSSPLAIYLFSRNTDFMERLSLATRSGAVGINDGGKQASNLNLPFGGVGGSGMGRYRGQHGFNAFTYQRPVCRRWFFRDMFSVQPPYAGKLEKIRKYVK